MQNEQSTSTPSANVDMLLKLTETGLFFKGNSILLKDIQPATNTTTGYDSEVKVEDKVAFSEGFDEKAMLIEAKGGAGAMENMQEVHVCSSSTMTYGENSPSTDLLLLPKEEIVTYTSDGAPDYFAAVNQYTQASLDLKIILKQREIEYPKDLDFDEMDAEFTIMDTIAEVDEDGEQE